jgi:DNA processing protein
MTLDPGLAGWLRLTLTPGLGPAAIRALLREFGLPEAVLAQNRAALARFAPAAALEALRSASVDHAVEQALEWLAQPQRALLTLADENYPRALLEIADPPPVLYAQGRLGLLQHPALAIVGSRNATAQGIANAESFARALSDAGLTIVSGLALGIDAAA